MCIFLYRLIPISLISYCIETSQGLIHTMIYYVCSVIMSIQTRINSVSPNVGSQNSSHASSFSDGMSTMLGDQNLLVLLQDTARSLQKMI